MNMTALPDVPHTPYGLDGVSWNILGQVYTPKLISPECFAWHAVFAEETFVPPHTHADQDEYLYPYDGVIDLLVGGQRQTALPGQVAVLPRGVPHAFFNNTGKCVNALFWAAPAGKLVQLYRRIHNVGHPGRVVSIAPQYGVVFEPPVSAAA